MANQTLELSLLEALLADENDYQKRIALARRYHAGDQDVHLTARAREFLGLHTNNAFRLNICRMVTAAVCDELRVAGFDSAAPALAEWAWTLWQRNCMDAYADIVHEAAVRDGEAFVIVDYTDRPRFNFHPRYVGTDAGGDGDGVYMIYPDNDVNQPAICAVKRWTETVMTGNSRDTRMRMTVYYPDRVERYFYGGSGWGQYKDKNSDPWPIKWMTAQGAPLGIPVIHFRNSGMLPEAWDAIPLQDATNKALVDLLATADTTAFRIFFANFTPTTDGKTPASDGKNWLKVQPGQTVYSTRDGAALQAIDGADVTPLLGMLTQLILYAAQITSTPVSRFVATRAVQSGESLKESERPLQKKVSRARNLFGDAWEQCLDMALRLSRLYGGDSPENDSDITTIWTHSTSMDELLQKQKLGVPTDMLWREAGYTPAQIEIMRQSDEYQAKLALLQAGMMAADVGG